MSENTPTNDTPSPEETASKDAFFAQLAAVSDAMIAGYTAVLCSPGFLYLEEPVGKLDDHQLANRLSYFLWASQPDWELRKTADDGSLLKPEVLAAQTKRMLRDPKTTALAKEFAGQ